MCRAPFLQCVELLGPQPLESSFTLDLQQSIDDHEETAQKFKSSA